MKNKILIIEDEVRFARLLSMELKHEGYETEFVSDGEEGLEKIRAQEFSAVLLDFMLPTLNGVEICQKAREFSSIPFILLTARDDVQEEALQAGVNVCLKKNFDIRELLAVLKKLVAS